MFHLQNWSCLQQSRLHLFFRRMFHFLLIYRPVHTQPKIMQKSTISCKYENVNSRQWQGLDVGSSKPGSTSWRASKGVFSRFNTSRQPTCLPKPEELDERLAIPESALCHVQDLMPTHGVWMFPTYHRLEALGLRIVGKRVFQWWVLIFKKSYVHSNLWLKHGLRAFKQDVPQSAWEWSHE